jgi:hypothetical protein
MALWNQPAARQKTISEPAQGEHLKGPTLDRQCTGLSDRLVASLQHCDFHFCKSELAGNPQPDGTGANYQDIEFVTQGLVIHLSAQEPVHSNVNLRARDAPSM